MIRIFGLRSVCLVVGLLLAPQLLAAPNYVQMARTYQECSITIFKEVLTVLRMNVATMAKHSRLDENRLHRYLHGEELLTEFELDMVEITFNDVKEIVGSFFDSYDFNIKAHLLLYSGGRANFDQLREYLEIETTAQELQTREDELTPDQAQLVDKVNAVRGDALARLEHTVLSRDINYYDREQQTSAQILTEILTRLHLSIPELAVQAGVDAAFLVAYQDEGKILPIQDMQAIYNVIKAAIPAHPKPSAGQRLRAFIHRDKEEQRVMDHLSGYLYRLTQDFAHAVRVEHYYRDARQIQTEQTTKDAEASQ